MIINILLNNVEGIFIDIIYILKIHSIIFEEKIKNF